MYSYQNRQKKYSNKLLRPVILSEPEPVAVTYLDPETEIRLVTLLNDIGIKKISAREQEKLDEAGRILRSLPYKAQQEFYKNYPELADTYFHSITGKQLFGPSPGFFSGIDLSPEQEQKNTVLSLLGDTRTYLPENEPLRVLLGLMVAQVGDIWSAPQPVNWNGNPNLTEAEFLFLNTVIELLAANNAILPNPVAVNGADTINTKRGFTRAALSGLAQVRNTLRGISNNERVLSLYNYSLAELQQNNEWKGDIYGMQFGADALIDLHINPKEGNLAANAATLPVTGLSYFSDNSTVTASGVEMKGLLSKMEWGAQPASASEKQTLTSATISVSGSEVVFNNLRLIWRNEKTGQSNTMAIGRLALSGVKIAGFQRTVKNKNLHGYIKPLFEYLYGLQDASYWMLYAGMAVVTQLLQEKNETKPDEETYSKADFESFQRMIFSKLELSHNMVVQLGDLIAENLIISSSGYIGKLETGQTNVLLTGGNGSVDKAQQNAIAHTKIELADLRNERAKLFEKKKKAIRKNDTNAIKSINLEILTYDDAIDEKEKQLTQTLAPTQHKLSITTIAPIQLTDARLVSSLITGTATDVLTPLGLEDATGLENLTLPQGFTLQSTLNMQSISGTRLEIPEFLFPKLSDTQFKVNAGKQVLTGTNAVVNNLRGKLIVDWTDVIIPKEGETITNTNPLLTITHASITGGEIEVNELQLGPANQPQHLSGRVVLKGIEMDFPEAAAGKFDTFELRIASIETADVAGAKLLASAKRDADAPTLTLTENTGSRVLLSGLVLGNTVTETAGQTQTVTSLKIGSGQFEQVKVNTLQGNFTMGGFECTITDLAKTTEVNNETVKTGSGTRIAEIRLQIENIDVPEFNFADGTLQLSNMLPAKDTARPARIARLRKQAEALRAVKNPTHDQLRQLYIAERRLADEENAAAATAAGLGVNLKQAFLHFEFTHEYCPPGEQGSGSDFMGLHVHALSVGQATLNNLQITTLKKGKSEQLFFAGHNVLDNLHIAGLNVLPNRQLRFDADGIISAGHTAIHSFVSDLLNVQNAQAGLIQFSNFTDSLGFSYTVNDFTGSYEDGKETLFGHQDKAMDLSGNYTHDEATGITRFTFNTADTIHIPDIFTGSLCFYSATGSLHASGVRGEVEFKTRKLANGTSQTEYVKIHQLDIDQLNAKDMFLYLPGANMTKFESKPAGITSISNIRIYGVEYYPAAAKGEKDRVAGHIETGKFDLANFSTISSYNIFTLLSGGVSGSALEAHTYSDGKFTYSISDAKLTAEELVVKGIHIKAKNNKLGQLFSAGEISYSNRKQTSIPVGDDVTETGDFYTIKNAVLNPLAISGDANLKGVNTSITNTIISGKIIGDLKVSVSDKPHETSIDNSTGTSMFEKYYEISAENSSVTIESMHFETTDADPLGKLLGGESKNSQSTSDGSASFDFLDHLVSGTVLVQLFGTYIEVPLYRIANSKNLLIKEGEAFKLGTPGTEGSGYSTYLEYSTLSEKISKTIGDNIPPFDYANNVLGEDELAGGVTQRKEYVMYSLKQTSTEPMIFIALIEKIGPQHTKFIVEDYGLVWDARFHAPFILEGRKDFLSLSSIAQTVSSYMPEGGYMLNKKKAGTIDKEPDNIVKEAMQEISGYIHNNMNPNIRIGNMKFDFSNGSEEENANSDLKGSAGVSSLNISLNQNTRYNANETPDKLPRKNLGLLVDVNGLFVSKFASGNPTLGNYIQISNLNINNLNYSTGKTDLGLDLAMKDVYAKDKKPSSTIMKASGVNMSGLVLRVYR